MAREWNTEYHEISISYEDRCIRIRNDRRLHAFLLSNPSAARRLADYIRKQYHRRFGKSLRITRDSLAVEIVWHMRVLRWMNVINRIFPFGNQKLMKELYVHMEVIDCGEREIDSNRFIWDALSSAFR